MKHLCFFLIALLTSFASFATAPIMGTATICPGSTTSLSDTTPGGVWSSSDASVAIVSTSGIVTGIAAGTTNITYDVSGVYSTLIVTVNPLPSAIGGTPIVCVGSTTLLTDAVAGGIWSSASTTVATISMGSGIVTGIAAGTTTITYAIATGCIATIVVTVTPAVAPISGPASICAGGTASVTATPPGGTWSATPSTVLTITSGGIITGISAGPATITYASSSGCYATMTISVNTTTPAITGVTAICAGYTTTLSDATGGGTWSGSGAVVAVGSSSGVVTGISAGTSIVTYMEPGGCFATTAVTVNPGPSSISGPTTICGGSSVTFTDLAAGGLWTTDVVTVLTIGAATGVATAVAAGTAHITYTIATGCYTTILVTVNAGPASISGPNTVCLGSTITLSDAVAGGIWMSSSPAIASVTSGGVVTGNAVGATSITYQLASGCSALINVTVNALPTITASSSANCGGTYSLTGGGAGTGGTYMWTPSTGLSCPACLSTTATLSVSVTYSLIGTDVNGCTGATSVTLNGNRISGYISLTAASTDTLKVWLIQFNPTDSSLIAEDSTLSCMDGGTPYYEFDSKPAGDYMVKAKLLSSVAGTSGYMPTYGLSSAVWDSAATITHGSATDTQHINMRYGIVPTGPGFIGGLISAGAGRGTSGGVPVAGMLVYLKDATGSILTYAYTDATGAYSFSGIANGTYTIYPMDYHYHTIPWTTITLNSTSETFSTASFYEHTTSRVITPTGTTASFTPLTTEPSINIYPNPAVNEVNISWTNEKTGNATIIITDIAGREVYRSVLDMNKADGTTKVAIDGLNKGIYFISIKSNNISYISKLLAE